MRRRADDAGGAASRRTQTLILTSASTSPSRGLRALIGVRAVVGTALLIAPGPVLRRVAAVPVDRPARMFARILGARHVAQAAITVRHHTPEWLLGGASVDAAHAATMIVLAARDPGRRRLALMNVGSAAMFAAAGLSEAQRSR